MPNWVYNGLTIEGNPDSVKKLMEQMNKPFVKLHDNWNPNTKQMEVKQVTYPNPVFAFHNIYNHTQAGISDLEYLKQPDYYRPLEEAMKFNGNDWYNFNVREWGTKWDVGVHSDDTNPDTYMEETANGENYVVYYNFQTAWSRPMPALIKLSSQYPDLLFTLVYQEETGWGGELELLRGEIISESMYDNQCNDCDGTYEDSELIECDDCGDYPCPRCGWSNDMCETHQTAYDKEHP
jgi:hypothetical protein